MVGLRLWCLVALISIARCQMLPEGSGGQDLTMPTDDEDDFSELDFASGSGSNANATSAAISTSSVTITSSSRTAAKEISGPKLSESSQMARGSVSEADDQVDVTPATGAAAATENVDLLELLWKQPGVLAGLIGGAILGVLFAVLLTLFIIYRLRRRADRAFRKGVSRGSQDDSGAFWFEEEESGGAAIAVSRASGERYPRGPSDAYVNPQACDTLKSAHAFSQGPQGSTLLYPATMSSVPQNTYDEYLAAYNQQMYNGYMQKQ